MLFVVNKRDVGSCKVHEQHEQFHHYKGTEHSLPVRPGQDNTSPAPPAIAN